MNYTKEMNAFYVDHFDKKAKSVADELLGCAVDPSESDAHFQQERTWRYLGKDNTGRKEIIPAWLKEQFDVG